MILSIARGATLVSGAAAAIDYGLIHRLGNRSLQTLGRSGLGALAVGLTLGGVIRRPQR